MTEEVQNTSDIFNNNQNDSPTFDFNDAAFFSPQIKPENIFCSDVKDTSEMQLASKILCFPFNLDCFNLIFLKDEKDPELIDPFCTVILGDIERVRFSDSVLKMVFYSKDRTTPLNLGDYPNEINSLTNFPGIEFICICLNKMFIQCEEKRIIHYRKIIALLISFMMKKAQLTLAKNNSKELIIIICSVLNYYLQIKTLKSLISSIKMIIISKNKIIRIQKIIFL